MSSFVVSARKYRPRKFEDVVGQASVTETLKNAIMSDHLAHALLFCGPRGVGKTTCARILSRMINADVPPDQFNPTDEDAETDKFNIYELDAASNNSVEDIRALVDQVRFPPQTGKYKVYIIDEVHMLSTAAFNAFLKTLEEPPPYAIFILATTEKHKIIPTILSRCQIYDFNRITIEDIVGHLQNICDQEGITADPNALHIIAEKADGALRDALSLFDRLVDHENRQLSYEGVLKNLNILDYDYFFRATDLLTASDVRGIMLLFDEVVRKGFEGDNFISGLAGHWRNLMLAKDNATIKILEVSDELKERYRQQGKSIDNSFLVNALNLANQCEIYYRTSKNKRLHVELALMKIAYLPTAVHLAASQDQAKKKSVVETPLTPPPIQQQTNGTVAEAIETEAEPETIEATTTEEVEETQKPESPAIVEEAQELLQQAEAPEPEAKPAEPPRPTASIPVNLKKQIASDLGGIRINQPKEETVEEEMEDEPVDMNVTVDPEALKVAWMAYGEKLRSDKRLSLSHLINEMLPEIEGPTLKLSLQNKLQQELFQNEKLDLLDYLKKEMDLGYLELETVIDKSAMEPKERKAFTAKEKLQKMAAKNEHVRTLVERLDLQLDD